MRRVAASFALLLGAVVMTLGTAVPAAAEFFGCSDRPGQLLYTYNGTPGQFDDRAYTRSRHANRYASHSRHDSRARVSYYDSYRY
jgi:hypothetical protein